MATGLVATAIKICMFSHLCKITISCELNGRKFEMHTMFENRLTVQWAEEPIRKDVYRVNSTLASTTYSPGAKYLFEDLLHPLVRKLFLHLK